MIGPCARELQVGFDDGRECDPVDHGVELKAVQGAGRFRVADVALQDVYAFGTKVIWLRLSR